MSFSPQQRHAHKEHHKDKHELAERFVKLLEKELDDFLCAAVLFGSCATHKDSQVSDIDILLIVDDVAHVITPETTGHYQRLVREAAAKTSPLLHINTQKLTTFWEFCRAGDPVITNMLRDGVVLRDKGFFGPMQLLLEQGRVRPSREAVWAYYARTSNTMRSARQHVLAACVDLYWAAMDASHAALMSVGEIPENPEHVPQLLTDHLVKKGMLDKHYPKVMAELYHLQKSITHREIKEISGEQYQQYWHETLRFVDALRTVVERHPPA